MVFNNVYIPFYQPTVLFVQPQEGVCSTIPTEEVEMEIVMEEEVVEDNEYEFSTDEEEEEAERNEQDTQVTSPKIPLENKRDSTGSLGFSNELSSILASKMSTLNNNEVENVPRGDEITKEKESDIKETGRVQQRRKPPPPPVKPKV